jgi:hypothetical protein
MTLMVQVSGRFWQFFGRIDMLSEIYWYAIGMFVFEMSHVLFFSLGIIA